MTMFKEMDPADVLAALEGQKDILTAEADRYAAFYRSHHCPRCKSELTKEFDGRIAWEAGEIMPRALLRCSICGYLLNPHSNLIVEYGDASKIPLDPIPYLDPES